MATSETAVGDLIEYGRINVVLEKFFELPIWTPAMGAMLISGVLPSPGCSDIPEVASQLRNPSLPASDRQLRDARKAHSRWVQEHLDEDDKTVQAPTEASPVEYLIWCEESYRRVPDSMRPSWLNYFLALIQSPPRDGALRPAPAHLVARALELEQFAAVVSGLRSSHGSTAAPGPRPERAQVGVEAVRKNVVTRPGRVNPIEREIRIAQSESDDPFNVFEVWSRLKNMAKTGKYPKLELRDDGRLQVPSGKGMRIYTIDALRRFIGKAPKNAIN